MHTHKTHTHTQVKSVLAQFKVDTDAHTLAKDLLGTLALQLHGHIDAGHFEEIASCVGAVLVGWTDEDADDGQEAAIDEGVDMALEEWRDVPATRTRLNSPDTPNVC